MKHINRGSIEDDARVMTYLADFLHTLIKYDSGIEILAELTSMECPMKIEGYITETVATYYYAMKMQIERDVDEDLDNLGFL